MATMARWTLQDPASPSGSSVGRWLSCSRSRDQVVERVAQNLSLPIEGQEDLDTGHRA